MRKYLENESLEVISETVELCRNFKSPEASIYHLMMIIWRKFNSKLIVNEIVDETDYDSISSFLFDKAEINFNSDKEYDVNDIEIGNDLKKVFDHSITLSKVMDVKVSPELLFYGVMRFDNKCSVFLKKYNITSTTFMKLY